MNKIRGWDWVWLVLAATICLVVLFAVAGTLTEPAPRAYHRWYYARDSRTWKTSRWLGVEIQKNPMDMQIYQEIIYEMKPDVLIETGTYKGGSAYFFASLFDLIGKGRVVTIDIQDFPGRPSHPRITYLLGSSTSEDVLARVESLIHPGDKVIVTLDSDHHAAHVLQEMQMYSPLVTPGSYLIVEDTNINGHPVLSNFGPGPGEAVEEFLRTHPRFRPDVTQERYGLTFNPGGWLRRAP